ncbi:MAG: DNA topoisomerase 1 [Alphaproteobacteria bacterium MarineAlpha3_Bin5]|nr:MAG: DNA topoisomerase 1 [Alphaproteobacteria bacterium MarineAlpha3_Bin5]
MTDVVVVESPAKAKTINKYLGPGYTVLATIGHIRNLPKKDGSVRPDDDFAMDWEIDLKSQKQIDEIAKAVKNAKCLFLATDPDREGEAISWHVRDALEEKDALKGISVQRVVFNEITKNSVLAAFKNPREINSELVDAYLARNALDYLIGFCLSPLLWRKLPGTKSAGRVQSVALKLICEREAEIESFFQEEYWSIAGLFETQRKEQFEAELKVLDGKKLGKKDLSSEKLASAAVDSVKVNSFSVTSIIRKTTKQNPKPPFTTSTLQQKAASKLFFRARRTMQVAQSLYQGVSINGELTGLITYMRTDGVQIAKEALSSCRQIILTDFGKRYLPSSPRLYKTKAKNAQEAHEAIRPTDLSLRPKDVKLNLNEDQYRLYSLIWEQTIASQMESTIVDQMTVTLSTEGKQIVLAASGSRIIFDGYQKIDREADERTKDEKRKMLPVIKEDEAVSLLEAIPNQHFTQPPPRYTEGSLVKKLEELGIGRPSTYHTTLSRLQDHKYVRLEKRKVEPEDRGRLVTTFLENFFSRYVEYGYTADLEKKLDEISGGKLNWKAVLRDFWAELSKALEQTKELRITEVLDVINETLGPHFFPERSDGSNPRSCLACGDGILKIISSARSASGAFIGCSNYPNCTFTSPLTIFDSSSNGIEPIDTGPKLLGSDPQTNLDVTLRKGPYGAYIQLGEAEGKKKPKRASLLKTLNPSDVDLKTALSFLSLPRHIGFDPETGGEITAGIGRFGPFIRTGGTYVSLKGEDDVLTIGENRAIALLAEKPRKAPPEEIGIHPKDKKPITIREGRYGLYVQHGQLKASLPKSTLREEVNLDLALEILKTKKNKNKKTNSATKKSKK